LSSPARRPSAQNRRPAVGTAGLLPQERHPHRLQCRGAPSIRIEAERIDQVDHGNEVALYNVRVNYDAPNGQNWIMVGDTAHVQPGGKIIDVAGNVRLQGENPVRQARR